MPPLAGIGLGANLGEPLAMIEEALRRLAATPGLIPAGCSSVYLAEPQGGPVGQNWYHNAVALFYNQLPPHELLKNLMSIENGLGRVRTEYCGPRVIDLDYLFQDDLIIEAPPDLLLPHPRMQKRLFVMAPLAELLPDWQHPILGSSASEILAAISAEGQGLKKISAAAFYSILSNTAQNT